MRNDDASAHTFFAARKPTHEFARPHLRFQQRGADSSCRKKGGLISAVDTAAVVDQTHLPPRPETQMVPLVGTA